MSSKLRQQKKEKKTKKRTLKLNGRKFFYNTGTDFDLDLKYEEEEFKKYLVDRFVWRVPVKNTELFMREITTLIFKAKQLDATEEEKIKGNEANNISTENLLHWYNLYRDKWMTHIIEGHIYNFFYFDKDEPYFIHDGICVNKEDCVYEDYKHMFCTCGQKHLKNVHYYTNNNSSNCPEIETIKH